MLGKWCGGGSRAGPSRPSLRQPRDGVLSGVLTTPERQVLRDPGLRYQPFLQDKWNNIPDVPAPRGNGEL